ncbi:helix-turn-helix transcriptional regulator [Selenomonas sp. WCA-380-WT-3B 3/]|uniref:Helix-turn-helix transcriptional regulator n=1 Tax=Selenomonas montiformis TaxID=2652285 RepID=A0A6I2V0M2_9FIRM|nr:helix-turn-helix transcriptional regulator [Selenomonas montiformis]MSV25914.1 helix-turn-helix transcriptional regulator [Selenomonas montiformis]
MNASEKLKALREAKGMSQADCAKAMNIDRTTYAKYENGGSIRRNVEKLAAFFRVSTDYLLGRTDEPGGFQNGDGCGEGKAAGETAVTTVKPKAYVELHRLIDELPHSDVEELLNTAIFKKKKAEQVHEHVDDPDDF